MILPDDPAELDGCSPCGVHLYEARVDRCSHCELLAAELGAAPRAVLTTQQKGGRAAWTEEQRARRAAKLPPAPKPTAAPREVRQLEHAGRSLTAREWSERPEVRSLGITLPMIYMRLRLGWTAEDALTVPKVLSGNVRVGRRSDEAA